MIFKIFASKYYPTHENTKTRSELISLITEPLPLQQTEQFSSSFILNNDEFVSTEQRDKADCNSTGNVQVCRICYSTSDLQSLIAPCECSGTMGILHKNCLERWLEISNTTKCEICQHEFEVTRYPKSLFYFFINPIRSSDIRYLMNDIILFSILTIIISWISVMSISNFQLSKTFYDRISYIPLLVSIICIYIVWCWVSFRYHVRVIREWRSLNQQIRVINKKENKLNMHLNNDHLCTRSNIYQDTEENHLLEIQVLE
ncbi:hypothetical protein I4U23_009377 [Adineta vaga]|nr:hypothetical protein I4U23_009377 [Adineta vaga]